MFGITRPTPGSRTGDLRRRQADLAKRMLVQTCAYSLLAASFWIYFDITAKGIPVIFPGLFEDGKPKFNLAFLTQTNMELISWEDEYGDAHSLSRPEFDQFRERNPDAVIRHEHGHAHVGGGIYGPLVGTMMMVTVCMVTAVVIGMATAVYLNEYSTHGLLMRSIRLAISNLAGVPSVVFGLFGMGFFSYAFPVITQQVQQRSLFSLDLFGTGWHLSLQGFDFSLIAAGLTLAVMILPVIITACEEALRAVPMGFRETALALGATRWTTIRKAVLPYALPGMLTATVLGITRVAGETAPIMLTGAANYRDGMPWNDVSETLARFNAMSWLSAEKWAMLPEAAWQSILKFPAIMCEAVQAMPMHIYTVSAKIPTSEFTRPMQYGSVFVFVYAVMAMALLSVLLRIVIRRRLKW